MCSPATAGWSSLSVPIDEADGRGCSQARRPGRGHYCRTLEPEAQRKSLCSARRLGHTTETFAPTGRKLHIEATQWSFNRDARPAEDLSDAIELCFTNGWDGWSAGYPADP